MQNFSVNSTIKFHDKEYQLITSNNGQEAKIICSLFREGEFINSKQMNYDPNNNGEVQQIIKKFHEQRKSEIEHLFDVSERLNNENNPELQNMLGLIFARNNMHLEAIREFGNVINRHPSYSWAYDNLGKALLSIKKFEGALKSFHRAIELSPNYADLYNNCGLAYLEMGACKTAVEQFDKAIELNPYYAEAYFNRALAYILNQINRESYELTLNFQQEVTQSLEKAGLINPGYQNKHYQQAMEQLKANELSKAFESLKAARYQGTPQYYRFHKYEQFIKLMFMEEENQFELIWSYIRYLQQLIKKYPNHADIYNDLGLAYFMLRNYINDKAISCFKAALDINPKFEKAQRNLKLSSYEKTGSELFLKAITSTQPSNGKMRNQPMFKIEAIPATYEDEA